MPDAVPPVDLASLAAGGNHPGALWRLNGKDLQANLVRLDRGDRIQPHRNDELEVLVVVVLGRGELTLDGQVHQLAPVGELGGCCRPLDGGRATIRLRETRGNLSGSESETHQHLYPTGASCCYSLLLDPNATIGVDLHKRLFLLVSGRGG